MLILHLYSNENKPKRNQKETDKKASVGSNQERGQMRFCKKCNKIFQQTTKYGKFCINCKEIINKDARRKQRLTNERRRKCL